MSSPRTWKGAQTRTKPEAHSHENRMPALRIAVHTHVLGSVCVCMCVCSTTRQLCEGMRREDGLASSLNLLRLWTERVVGWLTRPWKPFSRSGQSEPRRQIEWVWVKNVSLYLCVCVCWWLAKHARLKCCGPDFYYSMQPCVGKGKRVKFTKLSIPDSLVERTCDDSYTITSYSFNKHVLRGRLHPIHM